MSEPTSEALRETKKIVDQAGTKVQKQSLWLLIPVAGISSAFAVAKPESPIAILGLCLLVAAILGIAIVFALANMTEAIVAAILITAEPPPPPAEPSKPTEP